MARKAEAMEQIYTCKRTPNSDINKLSILENAYTKEKHYNDPHIDILKDRNKNIMSNTVHLHISDEL